MALKTDFTEGNVRPLLIRFALPLICSNLLQALYNAVDMFFVGKYGGTAALSAVSVCGPVMNIMIMTISGLSVGTSVVIGTHLGSGDGEQGVRDCANTAISLYLIIAGLLTAAGLILTPNIIALINTPPEAVPGAIAYLRTIFAGIVFMFGYNLISAFQRGCGDSRTPLFFVMCAALMNVVLDFLLIGGLHMGPFGAALATVTAQGSSLCMGILYFRRKKHIITFTPRQFRIHVKELKLILHMGLPAAIQQMLINLSSTTLTGLSNTFGLAASAAYGIACKAESFAILPGSALSEALATFCSQNVGACKPERAVVGLKEALKLALICALITLTPFAFFAPQFAAIFDSDPAVITFASTYMRIFALGLFILTFVNTQIGFVRGTGNSVPPLIAVVVCQYFIRIPVAFFLSRHLGFYGIAVGSCVSIPVAFVIYQFWISTGLWKKSKMVRLSYQRKAEQE